MPPHTSQCPVPVHSFQEPLFPLQQPLLRLPSHLGVAALAARVLYLRRATPQHSNCCRHAYKSEHTTQHSSSRMMVRSNTPARHGSHIMLPLQQQWRHRHRLQADRRSVSKLKSRQATLRYATPPTHRALVAPQQLICCPLWMSNTSRSSLSEKGHNHNQSANTQAQARKASASRLATCCARLLQRLRWCALLASLSAVLLHISAASLGIFHLHVLVLDVTCHTACQRATHATEQNMCTHVGAGSQAS